MLMVTDPATPLLVTPSVPLTVRMRPPATSKLSVPALLKVRLGTVLELELSASAAPLAMVSELELDTASAAPRSKVPALTTVAPA